MTRTTSDTEAGSVPRHPAFRRRKSLLTCPTCGHTSPTDGDWEIVIRPETFELRCPDCHTLQTRRFWEGPAAESQKSARSEGAK